MGRMEILTGVERPELIKRHSPDTYRVTTAVWQLCQLVPSSFCENPHPSARRFARDTLSLALFSMFQ
ncbi:MAG: hypothetical protein JWL86_1434 [Rhizobium sp.]|nr:hypothetical protein [Rhizobium sp.]